LTTDAWKAAAAPERSIVRNAMEPKALPLLFMQRYEIGLIE
jgi:hypothetical protein